jgi:hypothetical protein
MRLGRMRLLRLPVRGLWSVLLLLTLPMLLLLLLLLFLFALLFLLLRRGGLRKDDLRFGGACDS